MARESNAGAGRTVTVDLNESQSAASFEGGSTFFTDELAIVVGHIRGMVARLDKNSTGSEKALWYRHEALAVLGGRGLGKTSFLLSLKQRLADDDVYVLDNIDPTMVESNEIFLATIVGNVLRALDDETFRRNDALRRALAKLGKGLRLLAPHQSSGFQELWLNPELYADELLRGARGGIDLQEHFYAFVTAAAQAVGKRAFVQPIDDVDTAFERGWTVLETVRKHLTTPRFIVVLSGDLDLYRMLVRTQQWSHLEALVEMESKIESADLPRYRRQIDGLEDQYMLKVLPPHLRVELRSVRQRLQQRELAIRFAGPGDGRPLVEVFWRVSRWLFGWSRPASDALLDPHRWPAAELIPHNTRTMMRLFRAIQDTLDATESGSPAMTAQRRLLHDLAQIFQQPLRTCALSGAQLDRLVDGDGVAGVGQWVLEQRSRVPDLERFDARYVRELTGAEHWAVALLLLQAALYLYSRRSPGASLHIIGRAVLPALMTPAEVRDANTATMARLASDEPAWLTAARLVGLHAGPRRNGTTLPASGPGYLRLGKKMRTEHRNRVLRTFTKEARRTAFDGRPWWDAVTDRIAEQKAKADDIRRLDLLPAWNTWSSRSGPTANFVAQWFLVDVELFDYHFTYVSFYRGLLALERLFSTSEPLDDAARLDRIDESLQRAMSTTVHAPAGSDRSAESVSDEDEQTDDEVADIADCLLRTKLARWSVLAQHHHEETAKQSKVPLLPPPVLTDILAALHKTLGDQHDQLRSEAQAVGPALQRWVAAFFNLYIAAELQHRRAAPFSNVSNRGVVRTLKEFEKTLTALEDRWGEQDSDADTDATEQMVPGTLMPVDEALADTLVWMSCPLLLATLDRKIRDRLIRLLRGTPFDELYPVDETGQDSAWSATWRFATQKEPMVGFDVHEVLSALIMPPDTKTAEPTQDNLQHIEKLLGFPWPDN